MTALQRLRLKCIGISRKEADGSVFITFSDCRSLPARELMGLRLLDREEADKYHVGHWYDVKLTNSGE